MDRGTSPSHPPNRALTQLRAERKWGRPRLARELHMFCTRQRWTSPGEANIAKQIYRLETGRIRSPDEFYSRLYCHFFEKTSDELFGIPADTSSDATSYRIRSHKFVPVYVGPTAASALIAAGASSAPDDQWLACAAVRDIGTPAPVYVWPFGVAVFHLVEEIEPAAIADVAVWRRESYDGNMADAAAVLARLGAAPLNEPYVLSAYWVERIPLPAAQHDTALRLLSIPRVLTRREDPGDVAARVARASVVERAYLRDGFAHPDIYDFGIRGISSAFASWSGVVYHPRAVDQALAESELVACELSVQATWAYTDFVRNEVENGRDPVVSDEHGWRYLRGVRSRLTTERPQETSQHRAMREAVVGTSGLVRRLDQAIEALRDCDGRWR